MIGLTLEHSNRHECLVALDAVTVFPTEDVVRLQGQLRCGTWRWTQEPWGGRLWGARIGVSVERGMVVVLSWVLPECDAIRNPETPNVIKNFPYCCEMPKQESRTAKDGRSCGHPFFTAGVIGSTSMGCVLYRMAGYKKVVQGYCSQKGGKPSEVSYTTKLARFMSVQAMLGVGLAVCDHLLQQLMSDNILYDAYAVISDANSDLRVA